MSEIPFDIDERIWLAKTNKLTTLDLSYNPRRPDRMKLTEIPAGVFELAHLQELNLANNGLTTLPESITRLTGLSMLKLTGNRLTALPEAITRLTSLTLLDLGYNELATLPEAITQLPGLSVLNLSGNRLTTLPEAMTRLTGLTMLALGGNQLTTLPEPVTRLTGLEQLYLWNNQLTVLPEAVAELTKLTALSLSNNHLTTLPRAVAEMANLNEAFYDALSSGPGLHLYGNPLQVPPPEVAKRGLQAIREYFRQMEEAGKDYLYECKLLIVGEAGAGKTTLARKISDPLAEMPDEQDTTRGIDVREWHFPLPDGHDFRVNIWDFGGQEIYHATHQFFLTKRSLYILVADNRKQDIDFFYWLNTIELLSDNSPVLILKNEKQDHPREIKEAQLRGRFTNLKDVYASNLATRRGLSPLLDAIRLYVQQLPHVGSALPQTWIDVRTYLENDPRNYIGVKEYLELCTQRGFVKREDALQLSGYLHDLGVCLHFQDDLLLGEIVILKPAWGTEAVYKLVDDRVVADAYGLFSQADLRRIWCEKRYEGMHAQLLQLMMKFELCYEIPSSPGCYIVPIRLSPNQPDYEWDERDNLLLRYRYEFMPKGIITRLIVILHPYIAGQVLVWRDGVVLENDETRAEVAEDYEHKQIAVRVAGQQKRELLTIVAWELERINASYGSRLKCDKLVPCNCRQCKGSQEPNFYKWDVLNRYLADGRETIECQESYERVTVRGLVDDVSGPRRGGPKGEIASSRFGASSTYHSCFISYSSLDSAFAKRLYADLQARGVRVWFAPQDMKIGARIRPTLDGAIESYDKLLLVLSEHSIGSTWVEKEVATAFEKEQVSGASVLFPIRLDNAVMNCKEAWAADIRRMRHMGDFTGWQAATVYEQALARLLRDLQVEE